MSDAHAGFQLSAVVIFTEYTVCCARTPRHPLPMTRVFLLGVALMVRLHHCSRGVGVMGRHRTRRGERDTGRVETGRKIVEERESI